MASNVSLYLKHWWQRLRPVILLNSAEVNTHEKVLSICIFMIHTLRAMPIITLLEQITASRSIIVSSYFVTLSVYKNVNKGE